MTKVFALKTPKGILVITMMSMHASMVRMLAEKAYSSEWKTLKRKGYSVIKVLITEIQKPKRPGAFWTVNQKIG